MGISAIVNTFTDSIYIQILLGNSEMMESPVMQHVFSQDIFLPCGQENSGAK